MQHNVTQKCFCDECTYNHEKFYEQKHFKIHDNKYFTGTKYCINEDGYIKNLET